MRFFANAQNDKTKFCFYSFPKTVFNSDFATK